LPDQNDAHHWSALLRPSAVGCEILHIDAPAAAAARCHGGGADKAVLAT